MAEKKKPNGISKSAAAPKKQKPRKNVSTDSPPAAMESAADTLRVAAPADLHKGEPMVFNVVEAPGPAAVIEGAPSDSQRAALKAELRQELDEIRFMLQKWPFSF